MNDKLRIVVGLAIALVVLTVPFWYTMAAGPSEPPPELVLPESHDACVADTAFMRAHHMDLLDEWRDEVVREGDNTPVTINGTDYPKSLTRGCLSCHNNRQDFCARCHNYANVEPTCWGCHIESVER